MKRGSVTKRKGAKFHGGIAPRVGEMLSLLGEDPNREGLLKTPDRVEKSLH